MRIIHAVLGMGNLRDGGIIIVGVSQRSKNWQLTGIEQAHLDSCPLTVTTPDGSVYRPTFNEANLLDRVDVNLRGSATATAFVTNIDYNAKGQRELIEYGSGAAPNRQGVMTSYEYDPLTFRLNKLKTTRPVGLNGLASQLFVNPAVVLALHLRPVRKHYSHRGSCAEDDLS